MLLQKIEDLGLFDNTAVIFTSDHGFYLGEHGLIGKAIINKDLFEYVPLYEEVARIPLLMWLPGLHSPFRCSCFAQPPDITATILDIAGIKKNERIQGNSLLPIIEKKTSALRDIAVSSPSLIHGSLGSPRITIRQENWSLILAPSLIEEQTRETKAVDGISRKLAGIKLKDSSAILKSELYNLSVDPHQEHNLFDPKNDIVRKIHCDFLEFLKKVEILEEHLRSWQKP